MFIGFARFPFNNFYFALGMCVSPDRGVAGLQIIPTGKTSFPYKQLNYPS